MYKFKVGLLYFVWLLMLGGPSFQVKIENRDFFIDGWFDSDYNILVVMLLVISGIMGFLNYWIK